MGHRIPATLFTMGLAVCCPLFAQSAKAPAPPPPGQLIDVGGYRVHLYCTGRGNPTVMIVGGGFSFDWSLVQTEVARSARICTYDVSGTAWSDPGPLLTCAARVDEIHRLLRNAKVDGPYVLVGLSVGGLVARLYASLYPGEVAGMVIVDHAFIDIGATSTAGPPSVPSLDRPPVLIHQTPIEMTVEDSSKFRNLPEGIQKLHRWAASLKPALPTVETAEDCLSKLKAGDQGAHPLGDTPLVVISTGNRNPNYKKLQAELLSLSSRSEQLMATGSFHSVEIDEPDIVISAIGLVVDKIRQPR